MRFIHIYKKGEFDVICLISIIHQQEPSQEGGGEGRVPENISVFQNLYTLFICSILILTIPC